MKANINALNFMQATIGRQCKLMNRCVTCILFGSLKINLAAVFWINCRGLMELAGRPAKRGTPVARCCDLDTSPLQDTFEGPI